MAARNYETVSLGIDTGGTYTDAILFAQDVGVLAKSKSLTTKHDLALGISRAVGAVLEKANIEPSDIGLVSMSTTLATNALVEGQGGRVGLVMIGFEPDDIARAGLGDALGSDPVVFLPGGHTVHGSENPLDMSALDPFLAEHGEGVAGFAVAGMFAVRNPAHENAVRDKLREITGLPVTCSHELSAKLGGPKRALTTLLNSRLLPTNNRLIDATKRFLQAQKIDAPLMVVRGDGSLISSDFALARPIETILSGPAASLVGARYLTGSDRAIVSDIGGTTTDIAILDDGQPRLNPDGATVGNYQTMVEAVAMYTFGLGGDSEVHLDDSNEKTRLRLGPRRVVPLSLLAEHHPDIVSALKSQLRAERITDRMGYFVLSAGMPEEMAAGLSAGERGVFAEVDRVPKAMDAVLTRTADLPILMRLVSRGLVLISAMTPSDAMHVLGKSDIWNGQAAELGALLFAKRKDRFGDRLAEDGVVLSGKTVDQLVLQSANAVGQTCMREDGTIPEAEIGVLLKHAFSSEGAILRPRLEIDRPLIGLGASASAFYPAISQMLGVESVIAPDCDVANAIGAVVGNVVVKRSRTITSKDGGISFQVPTAEGQDILNDETAAIEHVKNSLENEVNALATKAGAQGIEIALEVDVEAPMIEDQRQFVQARVTASATGRPRIAR